MKRHLKRITSPTTWMVDRKGNKFITKPWPGGHSLQNSVSLNMVIKDLIGKAQTTREVKKILNNNQVLIDGKRKKDHRLPVGLFDIISFPEIKEDYRLILNKKGLLVTQKIEPKENKTKPGKILGKTALTKKIQLNLHDGKNILVDNKTEAKVGDTVILEIPGNKIKEIIPLAEKTQIMIISGKRKGDLGTLTSIKENQIIYEKEKEEIKTLKKYVFVLGKEKNLINLK